MPPLNESNQEPVSEKGHFSAVDRLNIRIGAVSKLTLCETAPTGELPRIEALGLADHGFYEFRLCVSEDRNSALPIGGT